MRPNQRTFSCLYDKLAPKIYRFVFFKSGSREIAEDLTAEVFLKTWQYWQRDGKKIRYPQAMLYQIARHQLVDFYRKNKRYKIVSLEAMPLALLADEPSLDEQLGRKEELIQVFQALRTLKPDQQDVLIWRYLDGLSYYQIAQIIQRPKGTVRVMVHRATRGLKKRLKLETWNIQVISVISK